MGFRSEIFMLMLVFVLRYYIIRGKVAAVLQL
jgi:hypothetical protein